MIANHLRIIFRTAVSAAAFIFLIGTSFAQLTPQQTAYLTKASVKQMDDLMRTSAERIAANLPTQIDRTTVMQSIFYDRTKRIMMGQGKLTEPIDEAVARSEQRKVFCANDFNRIAVAKGIIYLYSFSRFEGDQIDVRMTAESCGVARIP